MNHIKTFELFDFLKQKKVKETIYQKYDIQNYTIHQDGSISVDGDVDLRDRKLSRLPLKFRNVSGHFYCSSNQLKSLEGAPSSVGGGFYCSYNKLESLEGCPSSVGGSFYCSYNQLKSLEGCPNSVGGHFYCYSNKLNSLEGCPSSVGGGFNCSDNKLESLEGAPSSVGGNFYCSNNQIKSLEGCPSSLNGNFYCLDNPVFNVYKLFDDTRKIGLFNEFDPIQNGVIILDRLNDFLEEIGVKTVQGVEGQHFYFSNYEVEK